MSQKQQQQPLPAGLHIESGWSDEERLKELKKRREKTQLSEDMLEELLNIFLLSETLKIHTNKNSLSQFNYI